VHLYRTFACHGLGTLGILAHGERLFSSYTGMILPVDVSVFDIKHIMWFCMLNKRRVLARRRSEVV
jgi:hypothetical protein